MKLNVATTVVLLAIVFSLGTPNSAWSACSSPTGVDGLVGYDATNHLLQYCNGTAWVVPGNTAGGSTGYVQFNNASALGGDSSFFWDNTNKRLGIGTNSPSARLHVNGGADTSLIIGDRTTSGSVGLQFLGSGVQHAGVRFDGSSLIVEGAGASMLPSTWYSSTLNFIVRNGNVGIGTTSPVARFHVNNGTNQNFIVVSGAGIGLANGITLSSVNDANSATQSLGFNASLYSFLSGNVGIGAADPTGSKLLVVGDANSTSGAIRVYRGDLASSYNSHILYGSTGDWYIRSSLTTGKVVIQDTGGNVGIGTASPSYRLDVTGASGSYAARFVSSDGTASYLIGGNNFANSMYASTTAGSTYTIYSSASGGGALGIYSVASNGTGSALLASNSATNYSCWIGTGNYSISCNGPTSGISDGRLKKDIRPLEANEGLSAIMKLEPVHYRWKDERMNKAHPEGEIGFIAQNVETVLPLLVSESPQPKDAPVKVAGGMQKSLQYDRLVAPIVKAVQELKADNDNLRRDFEAYKKEHP